MHPRPWKCRIGQLDYHLANNIKDVKNKIVFEAIIKLKFRKNSTASYPLINNSLSVRELICK